MRPPRPTTHAVRPPSGSSKLGAARRFLANRWWVYQRERFPLAAYLLLAATSGAAASTHSALLRGERAWPSAGTLIAASASALAFFFQMRVADEFKDRVDDASWRPARPVPRGLVRLTELGCIALATAVGQVTLIASFGARMLLPLAATWAYLGLTCAEFGVAQWLKARPLLYLLSHLPLASLIVLQLSSFDWLHGGARPPAGLAALLATAFAAALVLDLGRKLRAPGDEQPGVVTYSAAWGVPRAAAAWVMALLVLAGASGCAAALVGVGLPFAAGALVLLGVGAGLAWHFAAAPCAAHAARLDGVGRAAVLFAYLGIGPLALAWLRNRGA